VYSGKIGFKNIRIKIIGKANSKANFGYSFILSINASESPLALIRFSKGSVIKVIINKEGKYQR
jgi:hypothetical protein